MAFAIPMAAVLVQPNNAMPSYPAVPGHKTSGTSAESAARMAGTSEAMRLRCLAVLKSYQYTADELAEHLGLSILSIRPRVSELKALKQIVATGARRPNSSGHNATVWRAI